MCTLQNLKYLWQVVHAFLTHHTLLDQKIHKRQKAHHESAQHVRICLMWHCADTEDLVNIQFNSTFVVDVESIILTSTRDVVTISCQADKVLLVDMTCRLEKMHICHQTRCSHHLWRIGRNDSDSHSTAWVGSRWRQRRCPRCWGTWRRTQPYGDPWTRLVAAWWTWTRKIMG